MSELHGKSIIAGEAVGGGGKSFRAFNPSEGREFGRDFYEATPVEIDRALVAAAQAFPEYRRRSAEQVAGFLESIALKIEALGDELIERAHEETAPAGGAADGRARADGQPVAHVRRRRARRLLGRGLDRPRASRSGSPSRNPTCAGCSSLWGPSPSSARATSRSPFRWRAATRRRLSPPAAPSWLRRHPAHPGTSELVGPRDQQRGRGSGAARGRLLADSGREPFGESRGRRAPATKAVGFTGSLRAGRALFDAAARRPEPIPVYAEMGSVNPVFVLPGALGQRAEEFAEALEAVRDARGRPVLHLPRPRDRRFAERCSRGSLPRPTNSSPRPRRARCCTPAY